MPLRCDAQVAGRDRAVVGTARVRRRPVTRTESSAGRGAARAGPPAPPQSSSDPIVGRYTLTVTHGCDAVPAAARTRTYAASIDPGASTGFVVTLSEAKFLEGLICTATSSGLGCHQFLASRAGDLVRFDLTNADDWHGGYITERVPPGTWLEVTGSATGPLRETTIEATGSGSIWYCPTNPGYPFPCNSVLFCESTDLRLTFTRR